MKNNKQRSPDRAERRLVYMSKDQSAALKRLSKRAGTSQAQLFRRGIDLVIAEASARVK
jgi:hypothetical protein